MLSALHCRAGGILGILLYFLLSAPMAADDSDWSQTRSSIATEDSEGDQPRGALLSGSAATDVVRAHCLDGNADENRLANITLWSPSDYDIRHLELKFTEFMRHQSTPAGYKPLHEYCRQYAGFAYRGKFNICVRLMHRVVIEEVVKLASQKTQVRDQFDEPGAVEDFWMFRPVLVHDGGPDFFSIRYDTEAGTFSNLTFDGIEIGPAN
jgi:hypothetical protein